MPVSFCVLGYVLAWLMLFPLWGVLQTGSSLLISDVAPNFNSSLTKSYDPEVAAATAASLAVETTTSENSAENPAENASASDGTSTTTTTTTTTTTSTATPTTTTANTNSAIIQGTSLEFPNSGEHYGQISCAEIGLDAPVYWYDSDEILAMGVGQSLSSLPPGYGTGIFLAAHNSTYFKCLQNAAEGQIVQFDTNYGHFEYRVSSVEVQNENDLETLLMEYCQEDQERLVMYTCYPFEYTVGRKTDRLVVTADKVSGPIVIWRSAT